MKPDIEILRTAWQSVFKSLSSDLQMDCEYEDAENVKNAEQPEQAPDSQ